MATSDSDFLKTGEPSGDFDDGLGEDWESAFQAEEFMFSPGQGEGDDFLIDPPEPTTAYEFTPPDESDLTDLPDLDQGARKTAPRGADRPPAGTVAAGRWRGLRETFSTLPLVHRIALGGVTLLLTLLGLVLLWPAAPQPERVGDFARSALPLLAPGETSPPENVRHKWQFAPFVLPVAAADSAEKPAFLEVDLSLILVLTDAELPTDKKLFVRDLIYRYYQHQSLATLRRFALARGEMNRNLLTWLRQHWPEAPIETVVFNRFQLT